MSSGFTFLLVPSDGKSPIHRYHIGRKTMKRLVFLGVSLILLLVAALSANVVLLERTRDYSNLKEKNRNLKGELEGIKSRIIEIDINIREFERIREDLMEIKGVRDLIMEKEEEGGTMKEGGIGGGAIPIDASQIESLTNIGKKIETFETALSNLGVDLLPLKERLKNLPLARPIEGPVSSRFGLRESPTEFGIEFHTGIDINSEKGDEIYAPANGVVVFSGWRRGYGNLIILDHGFDLLTYYGHNSRNLVRRGDEVRRGDVIGLVGSTGNTTGSHLHFEIRRYGIPINPSDFLIGD